MTTRSVRDPSPVRSGFVHGSLGAFSLVVLFGGGGSLLHLMGDADAAGPTVSVALFDPVDDNKPNLKSRLAQQDLPAIALKDGRPLTGETGAGPDLGVEYSGGERPVAVAAARVESVRINGRDVPIGQSLSQVEAATVKTSAATLQTAKPEPASPAPPAKTPFERYAAPFENPQDMPTVSVIVGGLGINWRHTEAAIKELPPEVTLSFAPSAKNLKRYVREARAMGHEVLIELPMEPYDYGRDRPHPNILQVAAGTKTNQSRLNRLLSQVSGYAGVTNYKGGKFATSAEAASPIFEQLAARGLAFFEDGSLSKSVFEDTASDANLTFAAASTVLDARPDGDEIEKQLLALEAEALEHGHSLGSGFAYPITIDLLKAWTGRIQQKGIVLAPASYYAKQQRTSGKMDLAALEQAG
ncbi:MAG: divergent polysaccharide deacetylase family protein [Pseudomonadota bacterium]